MRILYDLGIRIYYLLVLIASVWNRKAAEWISGRKIWERQLEDTFSSEDRVIWFHCASLGEFEQGRPLIEKIRKDYPEYKILLSFFSPSGYMKRKDYNPVDEVIYLPLDTHHNARRILELVPVEKVFFIKYEFWYHILKELQRKQVETYLVSGNFRPDQLFFRSYGGWYRKFLGFFNHIFVQNEHSAKLLFSIGIDEVTVAGDTRFDRVLKIAGESAGITALDYFAPEKPVLVAGSTWEKDEELLQKLFKYFGGRMKWIIAPHEPSERRIEGLAKKFGDCGRLSAVLKGSSPDEQVLLVDTIGHLSSLYGTASIAYIGGGFGRGIHNILEAAAYGKPVLFGPNYRSFQEAGDLISEGAAYVVEQVEDARAVIEGLVNKSYSLKKASQTAEKYVVKNAGATDRIVDFVFKKQSRKSRSFKQT